jgi:hypothetical protein
VSSIESDADLLLDLNRGICANPLISLEIGSNRQAPHRRGRTVAQVGCEAAGQRAGDSADDRRSREVIRVRVYNTRADTARVAHRARTATVSLARRTLFASIVIA